jgi:hypothetical protein
MVVITNYMKYKLSQDDEDQDAIPERINKAETLKLPYFLWESVKIKPEELKQQIHSFFEKLKAEVKPFTSDLL